MARIGVYRDGNDVVFFGRRRRVDPSGLTWQTITDAAQRELLRSEDLKDLRWDGDAVVRRDQAEIDARLRQEQIAADDAYFDREQVMAILSLILDEINILRQRAGLQPRTVAQAKAAYRAKLNR